MVSECCVFLVLCRFAAYTYSLDCVLIALSDSSIAQMTSAFLPTLLKFHGVTLVWFPLIVSHNRRKRNTQNQNAPTFANRLVFPGFPVIVLS